MARLESMAEGNLSAEITPTGGAVAQEGRMVIDPVTGQSARRGAMGWMRRIVGGGSSQPPAGEPPQDFGEPDEEEPVRPAAPQPTTTPPAVPSPEIPQPAQPERQISSASGTPVEGSPAGSGNQPVETSSAEQSSGSAGGAGEGGVPPGGRSAEQAGTPEDPHSPDYIWSPEFRAQGIELARKIIKLRAKPYKERYKTTEFRDLVAEWKRWCARKRRKSDTRQPFVPFRKPELPPVAVPAEINQQEEPEDRDYLVGIKESAPQLFEVYKKLRKDPRATDAEIAEVKSKLSCYFKEAKKVGLLTAVDSKLGSIYISIMKSLSKRPPEIPDWEDDIVSKGESAKKLAARTLEALQGSNRQMTPQLERLRGVWDAYIELTLDRFLLLLNTITEDAPRGGGLIASPVIEGEFTFRASNYTFGTESQEGLKQLVKTDAELRIDAQNNDVVWRLADHNEEEYKRLSNFRQEVFERLVAERDQTFRQLVGEREEAVKNLAGDREALRRLSEASELYWSPTYANYYEVYAKTPEQFQIAIDTFTQWLRSGLTKSPNELFQRVSGFKDALTTAGQRERAHVSTNFISGLRRELEITIAVIGADFANEHYNAEYFQQFLQFGAQDEGPARFIRLSRIAKGKVASVLHKFDNDPRLEMLFSLYGSRGEFMKRRNAIEQDILAEHILDMLVAETIGVEIKAYDPRDPDKTTKSEYDDMIQTLEAKLKQLKADSASEQEIFDTEEALKDLKGRNPFEANLDEIAKFSSESVEVFKDLFDGFDQEDQDRIYSELTDRLAKIEQVTQFLKSEAAKKLSPQDSQQYEQWLRQLELKPAERALLERLHRARRIQAHIRAGKDVSELSREDRTVFEEAKNAVTLAWETYGVMGGKGRKGGGAFIVDRVEGDRRFKDYIPIHEAENFVQFAENWTKATYGHLPAAFVEKKVAQARKMALWALKKDGLSAQLFDFTLYEKGKSEDAKNITIAYKDYEKTEPIRLADLTLSDWNQYQNVDIPGYTRGIGYTHTLFDVDGNPVDVRLSDNQFICERRKLVDLENPDKIFKQPQTPNVIGYDKAGNPVILTFNNDGRVVIKATDKTGNFIGVEMNDHRLVLFNKGREKVWKWDDKDKKGKYVEEISSNLASVYFGNLTEELVAGRMLLKRPLEITDPAIGKRKVVKSGDIVGYSQAGLEVTLSSEGKPVGFGDGDYDEENKAIIFDKPNGADRKRINGHLTKNIQAKLNEETKTFVEKVPVDFHTATHHIYARSTRHPYWGYQEQDTGLLLAALAGARRIKDGVSRPEDEEPHAGQLLIVDPTLERVGSFDYKSGREDGIARAAVEDSYQSANRIGVQLHEIFYPPDADDEFNRIEFGLQDFGGSTKMWYSHRAMAARWTDMQARRLRTHLPKLMINVDCMSRTWAAGSALGVLRMMNYGEYRMVGQFALEKWIGQAAAAQDVFEALYGFSNPNEKKDMEGLAKKPTNDADRLSSMIEKIILLEQDLKEDNDTEFLNLVRDTLGRFEKYLQRVHVLETGKRGERAPKWLKGVDIWERNPDGTIKTITENDESGQPVTKKVFNRKIDDDRNVGTAYHSSTQIFWAYVHWLRSSKPEEGQALYATEAKFYKLMDGYTVASIRAVHDKEPGAKLQTRWEWLHGKLNQP